MHEMKIYSLKKTRELSADLPRGYNCTTNLQLDGSRDLHKSTFFREVGTNMSNVSELLISLGDIVHQTPAFAPQVQMAGNATEKYREQQAVSGKMN
jgi:hypothetical protein